MNIDGLTAALAQANFVIIPDPGDAGALRNDLTGTYELVSAGAETRTLAAPEKDSLRVKIVGKTIVGTITITVTNYTEAGDDTIAVTAEGQVFWLESQRVSASAYGWRLAGSDPMEAQTVTTLTATTVTTTTLNALLGTSTLVDIVQPQAAFAGNGLTVDAVTVDNGQETNIGTAVPIVYFSGTFNTQASTLGAGLEQSFDVTNAGITALDIPLIAAKYNGSGGSPRVNVSDVAAGSFTITITNEHASAALDGDFDINYFIIKQVLAV